MHRQIRRDAQQPQPQVAAALLLDLCLHFELEEEGRELEEVASLGKKCGVAGCRRPAVIIPLVIII